MLALSLLALLGADPPRDAAALLPAGPVAPLETLVKVAAADLLTRVRPEDRPVTRYASLHAIDETERSDFLKALALAINGAQFGGDLVKLRVIAGGRLIRLNLRDLRWDAFSREVELDKLARLGVRFVPAGQALNPRFVDIWEGMAAAEPFFDLYRGTLPPQLVADVARESHSAKFIISAHWLYPRLMLERQDGGFYSFLLLLPDTEAQLYKRLGVDLKFADTVDRAKHGAVVVKSASVAYNPREIQLLQGQTGFDYFGVWRTLDFLKVDGRQNDVRQSPADRAVHDGREILFPLPNGLMGGYLANGPKLGQKQVNIVPQQIAEDQRTHPEGAIYSRTKSVVNPFRCWDCHGESQGIIGFDDNIIKLIAPGRRDTAFTVTTNGTYDAQAAQAEATRIEEFFRAGLARKAALHRASYDARVRECTGLGTFEATRLLVKYHEKYTAVYASELVTPLTAARETGYPLPVARVLWKLARDNHDPHLPNDQLGFLAAGEPITRVQWEKNVGAAFKVAATPLPKTK